MTAFARRSFLAALAASPVALSCSAQASRASTTTTPAASSTPAGSTSLRQLYLPGSKQYTATKQLFDPAFDARHPAAVAAVTSADEVGNAMRYAKAHHLRVAARSGGHSYIGASAPDGALVVDLRALASIRYDAHAQRATIGAGARLYDVHNALAAHGRAIPTGTCPTVGVSGLTAGGGLGVSSRLHGLTCDALVSARVVLADGTTVTADAHQNSDIFWALRGGGGGLVGLVTEWTFATHPATSHGSFILDLDSSHPEKVLRGWAQWSEQAPRAQWANLHLTRSAAGVSIRCVGITSSGQQRAAASALTHACGVKATRATFGDRSHMDTVKFLGGGTTSPRTAFTAGSDVIRTLDAATASALVAAVRTAPMGSTAILDPLSGAVRDTSAGSTAFPWRNHVATVQWYSGRTTNDARQWVANAHRQVAKVTSGRYLNYVESGTDLHLYLGSNTNRANAVRRQRDPQNLLIPSTGK